jgi:membrane protein DedA with SNARE-associated domain
MASTLVLYSMGRSSKLEKLESLIIKASGKNGFRRSRRLLEKHGVWLLVFSRFVPGIRSLLVIAAASTDMKKKSVLASAGLSVVLWYGLMVFAGTVLGAGINRASEFMSELTEILVVAVLAVLAAGVAVFLFRLRRCGE